MTLKRHLIAALDRPGGRWLLGKLATAQARRATRADVAVLFDECWIHRTEKRYFPDGRKFAYRQPDFEHWPGEYERRSAAAREYWFQVYAPKSGDVVVDVGAGRGEDVGAFSEAVGPTGRVLAIEAHPESFARLDRFCRLNRLTNVTTLHAAVSDRIGAAVISDDEAWESNDIFSREGEGWSVPMMTLGEACRRFGVRTIHFLKMNIEGAEREALAGMADVVRDVENICVACHDFRAERGEDDRFRTREFVEEFLADHDFERFSRPEHPEDFARDHVFGVRKGAAEKRLGRTRAETERRT
jgi:FkbM family methyltransferase